jgi:diguanylate cyclase (GGDEF)-like protein
MVSERILVVDDEVDIARVLELNLSSEGFEVLIAHDAKAALHLAQSFRPDLVLLDINMPGTDGLAVTRALRSDALTASTSIILLTAKASMDDRLIGLAAGADDYITKPFDLDEVISRVRAALRRAHQLRGVSPLTGLPGNFEILRQLRALLDDPDGPSFALIHADLDNFKSFNDHYGFVRGDEAIQATGHLLLEELGRVATRPRFLGHVGGDDFAMIVPAAMAEEVAESIARRFDQLVPNLYEREDWARGSIGVTGRDGVVRDQPFLTISLGIASTALRSYTSPVEMAGVASEMKQFAKQHVGSTWRLDRRRGERAGQPIQPT